MKIKYIFSLFIVLFINTEILANNLPTSWQSYSSLQAAINDNFGKTKVKDSGSKLQIISPKIAEINISVPIEITISPTLQIKKMLVFSRQGYTWNKIATFHPHGKFKKYNTRISLDGSSDIVLIAQTKNGELLKTQSETKVIISGGIGAQQEYNAKIINAKPNIFWS